MTFRAAVRHTPGLGDAFQEGLQALEPVDRLRVTAAEPRRLCGSVNLDSALRIGPRANDCVWDYAVCYACASQRVHWIEVHPASDHGVAEVRAKVDWLKRWLAAEGSRMKALPGVFVWISSGKTTFTKTSPAAKRLADLGVLSVGNHYRIR